MYLTNPCSAMCRFPGGSQHPPSRASGVLPAASTGAVWGWGIWGAPRIHGVAAVASKGPGGPSQWLWAGCPVACACSMHEQGIASPKDSLHCQQHRGLAEPPPPPRPGSAGTCSSAADSGCFTGLAPPLPIPMTAACTGQWYRLSSEFYIKSIEAGIYSECTMAVAARAEPCSPRGARATKLWAEHLPPACSGPLGGPGSAQGQNPWEHPPPMFPSGSQMVLLGQGVRGRQGTGTGHSRDQPLAVCPGRDYVATLMRCGARRRRTMRGPVLLCRCCGEPWKQKGLSSSHR